MGSEGVRPGSRSAVPSVVSMVTGLVASDRLEIGRISRVDERHGGRDVEGVHAKGLAVVLDVGFDKGSGRECGWGPLQWPLASFVRRCHGF